MTAVCWEKCHNACWSLEEKTIELEAVRPAVPEANDLLFPLGVLALPPLVDRRDARSSYTEMGVPVDIS